MSEPQEVGIIRPELVAHKLAAIRNYEQPKLLAQIEDNPRLVEMLWFIQYVSMQPGGLVKFCKEMLDAFPEHIGTETMIRARGRNYTLVEKVEINSELPKAHRPDLSQESGTIQEILYDSSPEE